MRSPARSLATAIAAAVLPFFPALEARAQIQPRVPPPEREITVQRPEIQFRTWRDTWRHVWEVADRIYDIRPAGTVRDSPQCPADLQIGEIVELTIESIEQRRFGDAAQYLARFQDRLYCLNRQGVRGVEFALAALVHLALEELPAREERTAVNGVFNLGLLAFDQLLYTGQSWWLPAMHLHRHALRRHLVSYPGQQLGLWIHHLPSASLVAFPFDARRVASDPLTGPLLAAFADADRFGRGECTLLGHIRTGFRCDSSDPLGGGSGGGAGGTIGGSAGGGMTACALQAAQAAGHGGALRCAVAAGGGGGPRLPEHGTSGPIVRGLLDEQCALRTDRSEEYAAQRRSFEESFEDWKHEFEVQMAELRQRWAQEDSRRRTLEEVRRDAEQRVREAQAAVREAQLQAELAQIRARLEAIEKAQGGGGSGERRPDGDGACADGTNASERVASLYGCLSGGRGGLAAGIGDPREPVSRPGPGQIGGTAPSGLLGCHLQGGGLVRAGIEDGRCRTTTCPQGSDSCSCDAPRGGAAPPIQGWMGLRELLFFEHGGGLTDPPRPEVGPEREIRPRPLRPPPR